MNSKANFLKRPQSLHSKSSHHLNTSKLASKSLHRVHPQQHVFSIKREKIKNFSVIGIFDRKVIVTYNNALRLFGCFDLHAVHQRIRYEYYCWKIKCEACLSIDLCPFDEAVIEKGGKMPHSSFGSLTKCLIKVQNPQKLLAEFKSNRITSWGICIEKNSSNEVFVTSFRNIYGRQFNRQEIVNIVMELPNLTKGTIPRVINDWIGEFSCKSAFKFNDNLTIEDASLLTTNLANCHFPWHCVHGRTTIHIKSWPKHDH